MLVSNGTRAKAVAVFAVVALMAVIWLPFGMPFAPSDSSNFDLWFGLHGKGKVGIDNGSGYYIAYPDYGDNDPAGPPPPPPGG